MKTKLPFALSAIGLIGLAVHQPVMAQATPIPANICLLVPTLCQPTEPPPVVVQPPVVVIEQPPVVVIEPTPVVVIEPPPVVVIELPPKEININPTLTVTLPEAKQGGGGESAPPFNLDGLTISVVEFPGSLFTYPAGADLPPIGGSDSLFVTFELLDASDEVEGSIELSFQSLPTETSFAEQLAFAATSAASNAGLSSFGLRFSGAFAAPGPGQPGTNLFKNFITSGDSGPAVKPRPTVEFNNLDSSVVLNSFADPSAVLAQQLNVAVGQTVENASDAALATSNNALAANATVINQLASQALATGESTLAVAVIDTTADNTTSTAQITDSAVGTRIDNGGVLSNTTSVSVASNSAVATARANDSRSVLTATGANSGVVGNAVNTPDNDAVFPVGAQNIGGDLIVAGIQQLDAQSNVLAEVDNTAVGLSEAEAGEPATVQGIDGGIAVTANRLAAVADGNRLALELNESLSGSDVDTALVALQTVSDTNVSALAGSDDGNRVGAVVDLVQNTAITVGSNQVQAAATGNRATATLAALANEGSDELLADVEQFVRAQTDDTRITASANNNQIGRIGRRGEGVATTVAGNTLTAIGVGNEQTISAALGQGSVDADVLVEGNQTLLLDGANLSVVGEVVDGVVGTSVSGADLDAVTTISSNTVVGQAIGNNASQASGDFAGALDDDQDVALAQTATGSANETLLVQGSVDGLLLGAAAANQLRAPQLTVSNNAVASLSTVNRSSQTLGAISGSSTDDGERTLDSVQVADSVAVAAEVVDLLAGASAGRIRESVNSNTASISVSGNQIDAQAELNRATQTLAGVSGLLGGELEPQIEQDATANAGGLSSADAVLQGVGLGVFRNTGDILVQDGRFDLGVSNNALSAQASANVGQTTVGAVSVTTDDDGEILTGINQLASDTAVTASAIDVGLGVTEGETEFADGTDNVGITVTGNSLQTLARQNSGTVLQGVIGGDIAENEITVSVEQDADTGTTAASNSGVFVGVTPAAGFAQLSLGRADDSTLLTVSGNTLRADAASNVGTITGSGISGAVSGGDVQAEIVQSNAGNAVTATTSLVVLGAGLLENDSIGTGDGGITATVADNSVVTVASGNNANASVGGVSGVVGEDGDINLDVDQTINGQVTAAAGLIDAGFTDTALGDSGGAAALTVAGNRITTAANGNDARTDFGTVAASITGELNHQVTQTVEVDASLSANTGDIRVGAVGIGTLGINQPVAVTVDGNQVRTSVVANSSTSSAVLSGTLSGNNLSVEFDDTQTINGSATGLSATSGSALAPIVIGVQADVFGANGSASVANNGVTSAVAGNRVLNNVDSAAFASVTGSGGLAFNATQTLNGNPAATADLLSAVEGTSVGVFGGDSALPAVSVASNRLVADTVGNQASRVLNNVSGSFNADTTAVSLNDAQTVDTANLVALVSNSSVGARFVSDTLVPTAVTVNGNQVVAQAVANSSNQQVSLNGASVQVGQLTSLNAAQNLLNSNVTATISNVNVGLVNAGVNPGVASFNGAAVTAGNSLTATAIGNQASLVRSGR